MKIHIKQTDESAVKKIAAGLNISPEFARLIVNRNILTVEEAKKYLYGGYEELSSPFVYSGMAEGAAIVKKCLEEGKKIVIYGDYDCDGVSAVSILIRAFRRVGGNVDYYIPVRRDEGYGLNLEAVSKIKSDMGADLLITVDCGIRSIAEVESAISLGMQVLVTDHHGAGDILPNTTVIDPVLNGNTTPLCGAGVALFLLRAVFGEDFAKEYIDICAVATVADVVPLIGDNRIIVKCGMEKIRRGTPTVGISELAYIAGIDRKRLNSYDIGFKIAPRLNAAGRLSDARSAVELLTSDDRTECKFLAEESDRQNSERQEKCKEIISEAMIMAEGYDFGRRRIVVLLSDNWNEGVIGIAAAKICEYFNLPTILMTSAADGKIKGSARSISGINITDLIATQANLLLSYGGHAMAAGLSLKKSDFAAFFEGISAEAAKYPKEIFDREETCDGYLSIDGLSAKFFKETDLMEPFGYGNRAPVFCDPEPKIKFSKMGSGEHAKAKTKIADVVCFSKWNQMAAYEGAKERALVYTLGKNYFNGYEYNQVKVKRLHYSDFSVSKETLMAKFAIFDNTVAEKRIKNRKTKESPRLDVFFDDEKFNGFLKDNPEVVALYFESDGFENKDTAVLAPSGDFPFGYYGKIVVHGKIADSMKRFFDGYSAEYCETNDKIEFCDLSVEELREVYKRLFSMAGYRYSGVDDLYKKANFGSEITSYEKFIVCFYILNDVKLLKFNEGGILIVNKSKTDMTTSSIFRYIYG